MPALKSRTLPSFVLLATFLALGGLAQAQSGERLFRRKCAGCHGRTAKGKGSFPSLLGKTAAEVLKQVRNPRARMPRFSKQRLSDVDLAKVARWVESLKPLATPAVDGETVSASEAASGDAASDDPPAVGASDEAAGEITPPSPSPEMIAAGKRTYARRCMGCHGRDGQGRASAPRVQGVGSAALLAKLRERSGRMPVFPASRLSDQDVGRIAAYLVSLKTPAPVVTVAPAVEAAAEGLTRALGGL